MSKIFTSLLACLLSVVVPGQEASISRNSNLRSGPSSSSRIVGSLPADTTVTIISKHSRLGYVKVQTSEDGKTGWVLKRNVTEAQTPESAPDSQNGVPSQETLGHPAGNAGIYPNPQLTPGKAYSKVTQSNIAKNICNRGWSTASVRPAASVTNRIKRETMKAYGFADAANHYELDHLLSLQNGGCPDCVENLWPEAYGDAKHPMTQNERAAWNKKSPRSTTIFAGALEKDVVENHIHDEVCVDIPNARMSSYAKKYPATVSITLERGQQILAKDWFACYRNIMDGNKPCE